MIALGQLCLLSAFVASGFAAFASLLGWRLDHAHLKRSGFAASLVAVLALSGGVGILAWALLTKDFHFAYVAQSSSRDLPRQYALSALWVGQAGSLLVWAWFLGVLMLAYRLWPAGEPSPLREPALGVLAANLCFLVAVMVFGADPMAPSLSIAADGAGLNPSLQHPAMLIHPPVVFLGYAGWAIPFALAVAALLTGRTDASWTRQARPWALFSWAVLGAGILLGAEWAYEELGWGGYWNWDPVENGSLMPWLLGTALVHTIMAWQHRGMLKKTSIGLAVATFGLCNFATFLTRSGVFSSLHAFGQSPIGWMFLGLLGILAACGIGGVWLRRDGLQAETEFRSLWTREILVVVSALAWIPLTMVALLGTLIIPISALFFGQKIVVGTAVYNNVLVPVGLLLLAATAVAPLTRWGMGPTAAQKRAIFAATLAGLAAMVIALALGVRHPVGLAVAAVAGLAAVSPVIALVLDASRRAPDRPEAALLRSLLAGRRKYAGYLVHLGFVSLAVGVTGSLGSRQVEADMRHGETIQWAGRSIRFVRILQNELPDKRIIQAELQVSEDDDRTAVLLPAQHLHRLQNQWVSRVAIDSTWRGDFYAILHGGEEADKIQLTLLDNPLMRCLWLGGYLMGAGVLIGLWPVGRRSAHRTPMSPLHAHFSAERRSLSPGVRHG